MALGWKRDLHLQQTAAFPSVEGEQQFAGLASQCCSDSERKTLAARIVSFDVALLASRCATLSKHDAPPYCYAVLLGEDEDEATRGLEQMRSDFMLLISLELNPSATAQNLAEDMRQCFDSVTRLAALYFERSQWQLSEQGLDILRLICGSIADSKTIEDVHKDIKKHSKKGYNEKLGSHLIQSIVNSSPVISQRKWLHAAQVSKPMFMKQWHTGEQHFPQDTVWRQGNQRPSTKILEDLGQAEELAIPLRENIDLQLCELRLDP